MVSVFRPLEADERAVGMPYVVFAGNVGDEGTLAEIVRTVPRLMLATGTAVLAARPRGGGDHDLHARVDARRSSPPPSGSASPCCCRRA